MLYTPWLATLDELRANQSLLETPAEQKDNLLLQRKLIQASADFEQAIGRIPMPYKMTRQQYTRSGRILSFDEDLCDLTSLTYGTTALDISTYDFSPANSYPRRYMQANGVKGASCFPFWPSTRSAIMAVGIWGYVPQYPRCWRDIGLKLTDNLLTTDLSCLFPVESTGLVEVGMYLKTDDGDASEIMQVTSVKVTDSNVIATLSRGELGYDIVAHTATVNAPVALLRFQQLEDIKGAVIDMALYKYKTKDRVGGRVSVSESGGVIVEDMDQSVYDTIKRHRRQQGWQG